MNFWTRSFLRWCVAPSSCKRPGYLLARWIFLRALGLIYFSAFYSLIFQIRGLLGPNGLLPAGSYLQEVAKAFGPARFWYAPTLLWSSSSSHALLALCSIGMIAALFLALNIWPRVTLFVCFVAFLSFVSAAQDFSGYQSDGMLLSAGFISLFFAPPGLRPRWGEPSPPSRASLFLLLLVWFTIYFESGIAKYFGGDPSWRNLTAMDQYYQNGPLPTWIGWYTQQLPHAFHAACSFFILITELLVVWMGVLRRPFRMVCFFIVTPMQISIILTANYTFLNYLVLFLGVLLLDDLFLLRFLPQGWALPVRKNLDQSAEQSSSAPAVATMANQIAFTARLWISALLLGWVSYAMLFLLIGELSPGIPLPARPVAWIDPFRVANRYGLFGRMTWARYEIEFQGSNDGINWIPYPFRYKPQDLGQAPRIYAPYQPRFDWNLWFASLGNWRENPFVLRTEELLLTNNADVLALFAGNPFAQAPPRQVRAVLWQYWMTDISTKRKTGLWWRREYRGLYAPSIELAPDGKFFVLQWPQGLPPPP
ncbi:MAG TPA: lipase maturation factor family protein [Candidatus Eremiobacteraceae bacterium]|nr:lipase maturation factor family protein [Candidatus Eremiobacteraceae bacterium]